MPYLTQARQSMTSSIDNVVTLLMPTPAAAFVDIKN
jgi:hypothetical protein